MPARNRARAQVTVRMVVALLVGLVTWVLTRGPAQDQALLLAWGAATVTFLAWTWLVLGRMSAAETRSHVMHEDPSRGVSEAVLLLASVASLFGVATMIGSAAQGSGSGVGPAVLGLCSVGLSWGLVHTVFTTRYADVHYSQGGHGVDFNGGDDYNPDYIDFAYLAFTIGMTYQVSDTDLQTREVRRTALQHALLSYLLGAVVLAMTINLVVQLASR